jgi:putative colanic acid biosynthesis UDP-glucose lipid carrier transferase
VGFADADRREQVTNSYDELGPRSIVAEARDGSANSGTPHTVPSLDPTMATVKRAIDIWVAGLLCFAVLPVSLLIVLAIKLDSPGSVLFRQPRHGLNGLVFQIYKFRTMHDDGNTSAHILQAKRNDPRFTRLGRYLRRLSFDELPQLINVLRGEMSLVGPRPHAVAHNEHYGKIIPGYWLRHSVKPGITGLAQVNGYRGETPGVESMSRRLALDHQYIATQSIALDLKIIVKTALIIWTEPNAY